MPRLTEAQVCELAQQHGGGVPPALIVAIAKWESGYNPSIVSTDGQNSIGLMQVTQRFYPDANLYEPATNIAIGAHVLAQNFYILNCLRANLSSTDWPKVYPWHMEEYTRRALAGYNAGAGNVEAWQKRGLRYWEYPVTVNYSAGIWAIFQEISCA